MTGAKWILLLVTGCFSQLVWGQSRIDVRITNLRNNKGNCLVCLFDNAAAFHDKGAPLECLKVLPSGGEAAAVFTGIAAGSYAIMVIHDANSNGKFDTNFLGIPKEGYGASGNKLPFAAAPNFEANKFLLPPNSNMKLTIRLRNL